MAGSRPLGYCTRCGVGLHDEGQAFCEQCGTPCAAVFDRVRASRAAPHRVSSATPRSEPRTRGYHEPAAGRGRLNSPELLAWSNGTFLAVELLGSLVVERLLVRSLIESTSQQNLVTVRNEVSLSLYALTVLAAFVASIPACLARRPRPAFVPTLLVIVLGTWLGLAASVALAVATHQPVVLDTLATHGLVAALSAAAALLASRAIGFARFRPVRPLLAAGLLVLLALAPAFPGAVCAADIEPSGCDQATLSGSLSGTLSVPIFALPEIIPGSITGDAELDFGFDATRSADGNWDLAASGGLSVGSSLEIGWDGPVGASIKISSSMGAKLTNHWQIGSDATVLHLVEASLANVSWQETHLPGFGILPGVDPDPLRAIAQIPPPDETRIDLQGTVNIEAQSSLLVAGIEGKIGDTSGVYLDVIHPSTNPADLARQSTIEVGFTMQPEASLKGTALDYSGTGDATGTVSIYLNGEMESGELKAATAGLNVSGEETAASGADASLAEKMLKEVKLELGGGLELTAGASAEVDATLRDLTDPSVVLSLLTMFEAIVSHTDATLPQTGLSQIDNTLKAVVAAGPPSDQQLLDAAMTLIHHSRVEAFTYVSGSATASLNLKFFVEAGLEASGTIKTLSSAFYAEPPGTLQRSATCTAPLDGQSIESILP